MGLSIANNVTSLNAQHNLNRASMNVSKSVERLSSGLKINRGADGPAALVISEKQRAQIAGLNQAIDNSEKAVSVVQTAEGALNEINSLLVKVRSLAIDSANSGVNDDEALAANQAEISNVLDTIDRIATNTQFGSKKLLDGSASAATTGVATDSDVSNIVATSATKSGSYDVNVTTAAEKAKVTGSATGVSGTAKLSGEETLTVTGSVGTASVTLAAGLTQSGVIDAINAKTDETGVVAQVDPTDSTKLRFTSSEYGAAESISVKSDTAPAGFGAPQISGASGGVLGADEVLTITGAGGTATVNLLEDDTLSLAVQKINDTKGTTGVEAFLDPDDNTKIRFKSLTPVGAASEISVTSDTAATTYAATTEIATDYATLLADETLTVTGSLGSADIDLATGDDIDAAIAKINNEQYTTGILASKNGNKLVFTSKDTGLDATLSVVSDVNGGDTGISDTAITANGKSSSGIGTTALATQGSLSSGVGTTALTDVGVDVVGTIDGVAATGLGNTLTATTGDAKALSLKVGADTDASSTVTGAQGTVTVTDNSLVFQIGANQNQTAKIAIGNVKSEKLGTGVTDNQFANLGEIDVTSAAKAQDSLAVIDKAISNITNLRGELGAFQSNTLESTANNLRVTLENTVNAESVIRDTDFASEIAAFTKNQVLVQAGSSMLSNANQIPQLVLSLLR
ncbi:MAG TPA: flagellin [Planctomycetaceae bacterium]|nr:flagellin [Planctomycetaceae bacterium]HQZ64921.1 flagellin [Planctomycetaceae bacterium]